MINKEYFHEFLKNRTVLGFVYSDSEIDALIERFPPVSRSPREILLQEGSVGDFLYIPTDIAVDLFASTGPDEIKIGRIQQGELVGLKSILTRSPEVCTSKTADAGYVFQVPVAEVQKIFEQHPELRQYLDKVFSSREVAKIADEINEIGCSKNFLLKFIGELREEYVKDGEWLSHRNQLPHRAFYVLSGDVRAYSFVKDSSVSEWIIPHRRWHLWSELISEQVSPVSYRSINLSTYLSISAGSVKEIKKEFPIDFDKYVKTCIAGEVVGEELNKELFDLQIDDLSDLFKDTLPNPQSRLKSLPWIQQHDSTDCGPACLAMVSEYHGRTISVQKWRSKLGTDREGTSLFDLAQGADRFGFVSHGLMINDVDQIDHEYLPCIVLRNSHYVVLYKVNKDTVVIGDPAVGILKITKEEFFKGFAEVGLFLRPTKLFLENENSKFVYRHFLTLFSGFKFEFTLAVLCSVLFVLVSLVPPVINQFIFDEVLGNSQIDLLWICIGAWFAIAIVDGIIAWARTYYVEFVISKIDFKAKSALMKKILSLPYDYFAARHVGDFNRRIAELEKARAFVTNTLIELGMSLLTIVIYVSVLFFYNVKLTLIVLALVPGFLLISMFFSKKLSNIFNRIFSDSAKADGLFTDLIKGIGAIKSTRAELAAQWRYDESVVKAVRNRYDFHVTSAALGGLIHGYLQISRLVILSYCVMLAIKGELSVGQVIALTMISSQVIAPFSVIASSWPQIQEVKMTLNRLNDILLHPSEKSYSSGLRLNKMLGEIEFRDVWFRYGGEASEWVLQGVSFKIEPGKSVAIVGPSGSGKSTIASLLARLYEPTQGQIFIDGKDYREFDLDWLRSQVGLLLQDSQLFHGTILENIAFNTPDPIEEKAVAAATAAAAVNFIEQKPKGFEYTLSHGGFGLSGGEKQRVALSRILYNEPAILVLDEATSALDGINEAAFLENLQKSRFNATTISIAHRFSTISASQLVIILSEGKVVGYGTHEDLKKNNSLYQAMFGFGGNSSSHHVGDS